MEAGAPSQPRERRPTRETHVMKPGEGGQVAPSLPGSGQTCLESQGRTRSSNPPTRSHLTQPAASPLLLGSSPPHPALTGPPTALPPASPPAPLLIHLAHTAQTAQGAHTASLCAEPEPEAAGPPCTPPTEAAPQSRSSRQPNGFQGAQSPRNPGEETSETLSRTVLTRRSAAADRSAQWPRLAAQWSGSPVRNRPPLACPKRQDWSPETYQGKLAPRPFQASTPVLRCARLATRSSSGRIRRFLPTRAPAAGAQVTAIPRPFPCRMDFAHMYQVYKSRRGIKRSEDSKVRAPRPSGPQPLACAEFPVKVFSLCG